MKYSLTLLVILILGSFRFAQPGIAQSEIDLAKENFSYGEYLSSQDWFRKYLEKGNTLKREDLSEYYLSLIFSGKADECLNLYRSYASNTRFLNNDFLFIEALALHYSDQFPRAIAAYRNYLNKAKPKDVFYESALENLKKAYQGAGLQYADKLGFAENLGEKINSKNDELNLALSTNLENRIYFNRIFPNSEKDIRCNLFMSEYFNGNWTEPDQMNPRLNTTTNEWLLDISQRGKALFFKRGKYYVNAELMVDSLDLPIEEATKTMDSPFEGRSGDKDLVFYRDSLVLFSAVKPEGFGGYDLYFSYFREGKWSIPINLGSKINTTYDEISPFLSFDGRTLYFSSNNDKSIGGFDVFRSRLDDENLTWSTPENLGMPLNSGADEKFFKIHPDGMKAYFASNKPGGFGGYDIYNFYNKTPAKEQFTLSNPEFFYQVEDYLERIQNIEKDDPTAIESVIVEEGTLPAIYYRDENILSPTNMPIIAELTTILKRNPGLNVKILCHAAASGNSDFDLFFTIKRAEKVGDYLVSKGVAAGRIDLMGFGANFPLIKEFINGRANPMASTMNNRIEFILYDMATREVRFNSEPLAVSEVNLDEKGQQLKEFFEGSFYKVQFTVVRQMYTGSNSSNNQFVSIESPMGSGSYRYTAGLNFKYEGAKSLANRMNREGVPDAFIVPYLKGNRLQSTDFNQELLQLHPNLLPYYNTIKD